MDLGKALEILRRKVSGYFADDPTDFGIEHMREHYLTSRSHPKWSLIQSAFDTVLEHCPERELSDFVRYEFNRHIPSLPEGARGFLAHIYERTFGAEPDRLDGQQVD